MARTPRRKKGQELPENIAQLVAALEYIVDSQKEEGSVQQMHCLVRDRMVVGYDGMFAMGYPITDDVTAAPHTRQFLAALLKCDSSVAITLMSNGWVAIKSGKFKANIATRPIEEIPAFPPDPQQVELMPSVMEALVKVHKLALENAPRVLLSSILLRKDTAAATSGTMLMEAFHGQNLPTMSLPKVGVDKLIKTGKPVTGFGYGGNSATFYHEDGSYMRMQLYDNIWPDIDSLLNAKTAPVPLPEGYWQALDGILDFVERGTGFYIFGDDVVQSALEANAGATYELPSFGIKGKAVAAELMGHAKPYMVGVDFTTLEERLYFQGNGCRGIIMYGRPY